MRYTKSMNIILRRLLAFGIDLALLAVYASALFLVVSPMVRPLFADSPLMAELTGFTLLTLPFVMYFAFSEASSWSASFGKRCMGLVVVGGKKAKRISFGRSLLRSGLKFMPWELAHFSIWHAFIFDSPLATVAMAVLALSYALMIAYVAGLLFKRHRTPYDRLSGTQVIRGKAGA